MDDHQENYARKRETSVGLVEPEMSWSILMQFWYPGLEYRTYFVPPVHFNRVPVLKTRVAGHLVNVRQEPGKVNPVHQDIKRPLFDVRTVGSHVRHPGIMWNLEFDTTNVVVSDNDVRDDIAQQHVLHSLQRLADKRKETMFVLSQLQFGDYLSKPFFGNVVDSLPRAVKLGRQYYDRGDFDILIIHRTQGLLIGEIKSVGFNDTELQKTTEQSLSDLAKRVEKSVKQLDRAELVVRYLVSDLPSIPSVKKTHILPYVESKSLHRVLDRDSRLQESFCQGIGASDAEKAVQLTLCSDQLYTGDIPDDPDDETSSKFEEWWELRMGGDDDPNMSFPLYRELVSRFAGPATTVSVYCPIRSRAEVRILWEAVSELGERLSRITLTPEQVDIVNRHEQRVCVAGPPGTGKSLMLVLVGLHWLREGHVVVVLSTTGGSLAASKLIYKQLEVTYRNDLLEPVPAGRLRFLKYDMHSNREDVDKAIKDLLSMAKECGGLHIIMDEAKFAYGKEVGQRLHRLVAELSKHVLDLSIWAATLEHIHVPKALQVKTLTLPLRSVPAIVREVKKGLDRYPDHIERYDEGKTPPVSDGPCVIRLRHHGNKHTEQWPVQCHQCGLEIADVLLRTLHVGFTADASPPPLQYLDVFVLTRSTELHDDLKDHFGNITEPAAGVVAGLRAARVPVRVVCYRDDQKTWERGVEATAFAQDNVVTVANHTAVSGLERKVVVFLPGVRANLDPKRTCEQQEARDRIIALSRCMAQLVMVDMPEDT